MSANILSRTSLSLAAIGMFFGTSALAADYTFPSAGGDISSQDAWGGHLPEAGDTATFNQAGTYTASADVALPTVVVKKNGIVFAMTNEPTRTVTLTGDDAIKTQIANGRVEYRGGVWRATSTSSTFSVGANSTYYGNEMALNGATFADFVNVYVGFKSSSSDTLVLTNGASVCGSDTFVCVARTPSAGGHRLVMNTGSSLDVKTFNTDMAGTRSESTRNNSVLVSGDQTSIKTSGAMTIGCRHDQNVVCVDDQATLSVGASLILGDEADTRDNALVMSAGAGAEITGDCSVGNKGSCNALVISNASFSVSGAVKVGVDVNSFSNTLVVAGEDAVFSSVKSFAFGNGAFNRIVFSDGYALDRSSGDVTWAAGVSNNVVRIENGASYATKNCWLGQSATGRDNRLEIGDGASYTAYRFHTTSIGNGLVISNGTFCGTSSTESGIGDPQDGAEAPTNNFIRLEGNCPAVRFSGENNKGLRVQNFSRMEFAVPAGGYLANHVPITGGKFAIDETCDIFFELDDYLSALGDERDAVTLVSVERGITVPDEVLARANARLPKRCALVLDGYKLILKTKSGKGLVLLFR